MSDLLMKRGERMARWMIGRFADADMPVQPFKDTNGWNLKFLDHDNRTPEQHEVFMDAMRFAIGYPRNFATMCLILQREGRQ